jgi:hypothetical protein
MVSVINSARGVLVALILSLPYEIVFKLSFYHLGNGSMPGLWTVLDYRTQNEGAQSIRSSANNQSWSR